MANTTNLNLVKPAGTDKALVSVLNSNSDKIDAFAGSTNQALSNQNPKRGAVTASQIVNDTSIMDLEPGTYQNTIGNNVMPYLPTGYGTLDIADSGVAYKTFIYTSTANDIYYRICHKTNKTWYGGWQQFALKSDVEDVAKTYYMSWGTTLSWTSVGVSRISINNIVDVIVWSASTSEVNILATTENGTYKKSGTGTVKFGSTSTAENYQITRSGTTLTFTSNSNCTLKVFT